jgi:histidyl-tRNA synthetase
MYEFSDKKGREFVLRPEGTAGVVRAYVDNKLYSQKLTKLYYLERMFRYERPQANRYREFSQFGIEAIGVKNPFIDAEIIQFGDEVLKYLKINYKLIINSVGDTETKAKYSKALTKYLNKYKDQLSPDSIKRLNTNPLRILDDKIDGKKDFVMQAPKISTFYSPESKKYFSALKLILDQVGIEYEINSNLVRGLDYYSDTIFEFVSTTNSSNSQATLIGGGRYDQLVEKLGGPNLSGIGFGLGLERVVNEISEKDLMLNNAPDIFIANLSSEANIAAHGITHLLRTAGYSIVYDFAVNKIAKAFGKAEKARAQFILIVGLKELQEGKVNLKNMTTKTQVTLDIETELLKYLEIEVK